MTEVKFYLHDNDMDRLFAIKEAAGKDDMTGNEFAKELLEKELYRLHPQRVEFDEAGNIIKKN